MEGRRRFQCPQCSFDTSKKSNLIRHTNNIHDSSSSTTILKLECAHCSYTTNSKFNLQRHLSRSHEGDCNKAHQKKLRIVCPICESKFEERAELNEHLATLHSEIIEDEMLIFQSVAGKYIIT